MFQSVTSAEGPVKKVVLVHDVALQRVELEKLVCTSIVLKLWGRNKAIHARVYRSVRRKSLPVGLYKRFKNGVNVPFFE